MDGIGERLKLARRMARLSQQALADRTGVSKMAISKYERNQMMPGSEVLVKLANVLGVRMEFLLRSAPELEIKPAYRAHSQMNKTEETSKVELGNQFFSSRSEVRNFLGRAKGPVTLIDSQIGATTLVCLDGIKHKIRLLTSSDHEAIEGGFLDKLKKFRQSGHEIEIRRHVMIHDRYIFYNGRCWIASCSLNEVGRLQMSVIESIDAKSSIAKILEQKWREAKVHVM